MDKAKAILKTTAWYALVVIAWVMHCIGGGAKRLEDQAIRLARGLE